MFLQYFIQRQAVKHQALSPLRVYLDDLVKFFCDILPHQAHNVGEGVVLALKKALV